MTDSSTILTIIRALRIGFVKKEKDLQETIALALMEAEIDFSREVYLDPVEKKNRVDFLVGGTIVIECKKHKAYSRDLHDQIARYATFPQVKEIIVVVGGSVFKVAPEVNGKPVHYIALHKLHGISV